MAFLSERPYTRKYITIDKAIEHKPSKAECCFINIVDKHIETQSTNEENLINLLLPSFEFLLIAICVPIEL